MLVNLHWRLKFPEAVVCHLSFFKSDHRALLMQMSRKNSHSRNRRPFRFLASWLMHEDFPSFMARAWPRNVSWCRQIPLFQTDIKSWNRKVFGNIFDRKSRLINRLEVISDKLCTNPSVELETAHKRLWHEYEQVLLQKELMWFQKSRSKWLSFGD